MAGVTKHTGHPVIMVVIIVIVVTQAHEAGSPVIEEMALIFLPAFINEASK
jgi:hypothetical protein